MYARSLVFGVVLAAVSLASAQPGDGRLQIHHIDMGQGDGAVLISPQGKVILFDAGLDIAHVKKCSTEIAYLTSLRVKQIDAIFVSHYHSDHIGCIPDVLQKFPLEVLVIIRNKVLHHGIIVSTAYVT